MFMVSTEGEDRMDLTGFGFKEPELLGDGGELRISTVLDETPKRKDSRPHPIPPKSFPSLGDSSEMVARSEAVSPRKRRPTVFLLNRTAERKWSQQ